MFLLRFSCYGCQLSFVSQCCHLLKGKCSTVFAVIFWARVWCRLAPENTCFRMRITLGVVLIRSLVVPYAFQDVSGAVPEGPSISGFIRKSSRRDSAPNMWFSVQLTPATTSLWLFLNFLRNLIHVIFLWFGNIRVLSQSPARMSFTFCLV